MTEHDRAHLELLDELYSLTRQTLALVQAVSDEETVGDLSPSCLSDCLWLAWVQLDRIKNALNALADTEVFQPRKPEGEKRNAR